MTALTTGWLSPANIILKNNYLLNGRTNTEDIIIPEKLYQKRNQAIVNHDNIFYIKKNTHIVINPHQYLENGFVIKNKKLFLNPYHIFIKAVTNVIFIKNRYASEKLVYIKDDNGPRCSLKIMPLAYQKSASNFILTKNNTINILSHDSGAGISFIKYCLQNNTCKSYEKSFSVTNDCRLNITAVDALNNTNQYQYRLTIDSTPPDIQCHIKIVKNSTYTIKKNTVYFYNGKLRLKLSATDNLCYPAEIFYAYNTDQFLKYEAPLTIAHNTTLYYYSKDKLGNASPVHKLLFQKKPFTDRGSNVK
ncbi:MAG TPA: hypothetical protein VKS21_09735 [Spirochaetota bacterium]|nr:hypothetical protein [Spirochaetota bacterium]